MTAPSPAEERERLSAAYARFGLPPAGPAVPLAGDVGQRRYFRLASKAGASVVLVLYPAPSSPAQDRWTEIGKALSGAGIRVPALLDDDPSSGTALEEDLGDHDLAGQIREAGAEERERLLDEAEELLVPLRRIARSAASLNPPFDAAFFGTELAHTRRWALERDGRAPLPPDRSALWEELAGRLARDAADPARSGDPVPTHRDFHANNLMRTTDGALAVIDFQDLRFGPPDYDPVSLRFERAGTLAEAHGEAYSEAVLLQRAWKVLGTFEKMLALGREVYRPHRDAALRAIRVWTRSDGPYRPLLAFLPG
ncbi:MAG TPA: phosphotransferase [Thermoanaerobaculia bacterium]|nr:phosphotransferase [Thermoanaerobaculia bacterium]